MVSFQVQIRRRLFERRAHRYRLPNDRALPGLYGCHYPVHAGEEAIWKQDLFIPSKKAKGDSFGDDS